MAPFSSISSSSSSSSLSLSVCPRHTLTEGDVLVQNKNKRRYLMSENVNYIT